MNLDMNKILELMTQVVVPFGIRALGGIGILVVGWIAAAFLARWVRRGLTRAKKVDDTLVPFFTSLIRWAVLAFAVLAMLNKFGIQTASLIAVFGAAGLAVGLALQGTLSHFAAGVMLLIFRPFKVGEWVEIGGILGEVIEISLFTTELRPPDGIVVLIPNGAVWGAEVKNFTRNGKRRISMTFGIGYGDSMDRGLEILKQLVPSDSRVLQDPAPVYAVDNLGNSSVDLVARFWVVPADYIGIQGDIRKAVKERFDAEGLNIPYPQMDVHLHQAG